MPTRPFMIAVGGDGATGKTTLCRGLERIFGSDRMLTVSLEDYHALDRSQRKAVGFTPLDPRANNFAAMEEDLWALREGRAIEKPVYDHSDGTFREPVRIEPKEFIIVQGLFPLYTRAIRSLFDVTVWLDPEPELKAAWKIARDTRERGYGKAEVEADIERRRPDYEKYVAPQAKRAAFTVSFYRPEGWREGSDPAKLSARIRKSNRFRPLDYSEFASPRTSIREIATADTGYPETVIELDGAIEHDVFDDVADRIWTHIDRNGQPRPSGIGEFRDSDGNAEIGGALALAQLLIARRIALVQGEVLEMV